MASYWENSDSSALKKLVGVYWRVIRDSVLDYETGSERGNLSDSPALTNLDEALLLNVSESGECLL